MGLAIAIGLALAAPALADVPTPPGPGVMIDVTGFGEPSTASPDNCTGTDPVSCPTLREAIMFANGNTATDGTQTQDTIVLSEGTYMLTIEGSDDIFEPDCVPTKEDPCVTIAPDAAVGDLDLTESVIIEGAGAALTTIEWSDGAATKDRIFQIYDPTEDVFAEIRGLTVRNGELLAESLGVGPPSDLGPLPTELLGMHAGGGIAMGPAATVVISDPNKEGGSDSGGEGGSRKPDDHDETGGSYALNLDDVQISDNTTAGDGGGLYNAGPVISKEIVITGNTAGKNGGGIYNEGESLIERSTIADNAAEGGGGMFVTGNPATSLSVNSTTFSGNTAIGGGAISGRVVEINLTNCTVSGNVGADVGGGVYSNGVVNIASCSIVDNAATGAEQFGGAGINVFNSGKVRMTIVNTLLSGNLAGAEGGSRDANCGCTGSQSGCVDGMNRKIETLGYNLSDDESCNLDEDGDLVADALIGPLDDNQGPTLTHALLEGSPAIDTGSDDDECPNNDQRGSIRPADGDENGTFICDIGAFELFPEYMDLHLDNVTAPDKAIRGDRVPIGVEAHNGALGPVTDVVLTTTVSAELVITAAIYSVNDGDPGSCAQAGGTVTCMIGTMESGDVATVDIETTADSVGTADIGVMVTSPDDLDETNNSGSAMVEIRGVADMQLVAETDALTVTVGNTATITSVVTNNGPDGATGVRVTSEVPSGTTFVSATPDTGSCVESDGLVDCELGDMAAGGSSVSIVMELTAEVAGTVDAASSVGAYESDPDVENNTGSTTITIDEPGGGGRCAASPGAGDSAPLWPAVVLMSVLCLAWRRRPHRS